MSVTLNEDLISLSQAARELPGRPHLSTIWRWTTRGVRGVVLETLVVAGRRFTSHEALQRFVAARPRRRLVRRRRSLSAGAGSRTSNRPNGSSMAVNSVVGDRRSTDPSTVPSHNTQQTPRR